MDKVIKKYIIARLIIFISTILILLIIAFLMLNGENKIILILLMAAAVYLERLAIFKSMYIVLDVLFVRLDGKQFNQIIQKNKKYFMSWPNFFINAAVSVGDYQTAANFATYYIQDKKSSEKFKIFCLNTLACIYFELRDFEKLRLLLDKTDKDDTHRHKKHTSSDSTELLNYFRFFLERNYEACIDFCEKRVAGFNPNSRYTKIKKLQIDFYYAVACYENGQTDKAKEKFSGIVSAAPDLYTANVSQKYLDAIEQDTAPDFSETKIVPDEDFRIHYKKTESKIYFRRILFNLLTAISFALVTILCFLSYFESKNNQPSQIETEIMAALDEKYGKSNSISYFYFDKEYYENIFCLADIEDELYFVEIVSNADGVKSVVPLVEKMEVDLNYCVKATFGDFYIDLSVRSSKPAYDSTLSQREVRFKNKTYWFYFNILEENPWIDLQINCMTS